MTDEIRVVIGSWGSYNECNERASGSQWLTFSDYEEWDEIAEELKNEGFELDGIDEELFIQDIEGLPSNACNWDYTNPKQLFETLKESGVLDDDNKYEVLLAYLEVEWFSDFEERVSSKGENWDDGIYLYRNYDWADYGREMLIECSGYNLPESILDFINYEDYGKYWGYDNVHEYSDGLIEISY